MNFYKHYLGDYARKTGHLSLAEHGAYRRLLDHYYGTGKSLPADIDALCRVCGAISQPERQAVSSVADEYFPVNGDGRRHNPRADEELKSYDEKATHSRENGKLGGRPRITQEDTQQVSESEPRNNLKLEVRSQKLEVKKLEAIKNKPKAQAPFVLPDWIPVTQWEAWIEGRKKVRKAPTEWAKRLAVAKLDELRAQGHPPGAVLAESAFNNWSGLFPPKEKK